MVKEYFGFKVFGIHEAVNIITEHFKEIGTTYEIPNGEETVYTDGLMEFRNVLCKVHNPGEKRKFKEGKRKEKVGGQRRERGRVHKEDNEEHS